MAVHARLGRRHSGRRGTLDPRVAVAAIDAVVAHVMLVAELDRLIARHILIRQIRRARREQNTGQRDARQKYAGKDTDSRDEVCASMKNLRHVLCVHSEGERSGKERIPRRPPTTVRVVRARVQFDATSFQQNFLDCNICATFRVTFP